MSVDFHYGGLPPAMAREMERLATTQQVAPSLPELTLPELPTPQSMQMPQYQGVQPAPQAPQMQGIPSLDSIQQYMPQPRKPLPTSPYQNANGTMPDARLGAYEMPQMQDYVASRQAFRAQNVAIRDSMKAPANQMNMGVQPSGGSKDMADVKVSKGLGALSARYESNGNPATIARTKGDIGGASYGTYQLTTASGHASKFASSYGGALKGKKAGTAAFDAAWKAEAKKNPKAFANAQHKYIENNHYKPAANNIKKKTGFDVGKYPKAVQDAVWSMGVQHGAGGAANIFKNAGVKNGMSAEQVLKKVYGERMKTHIYFKSSPKNIQNSVKNRFQDELNNALKML